MSEHFTEVIQAASPRIAKALERVAEMKLDPARVALVVMDTEDSIAKALAVQLYKEQPRARYVGALVERDGVAETLEAIVPGAAVEFKAAGPDLAVVLLAHDHGWVLTAKLDGDKLMLEGVQTPEPPPTVH